MVCSTFEISAIQISLTLLGITFYMSTFTFIFYLVWYLYLVGSREAQKIQPAYSRLYPVFVTVCFEFYFLAFHFVVIYITILFYEYLLVSWSCTSSRQDPRWLRKYDRLKVLHALKVSLAHFIYFLIYGKTFLLSMLVSHCCGVTPYIYFYALLSCSSSLQDLGLNRKHYQPGPGCSKAN